MVSQAGLNLTQVCVQIPLLAGGLDGAVKQHLDSYLRLSVMPPNTPVPIVMLAHLWGCTALAAEDLAVHFTQQVCRLYPDTLVRYYLAFLHFYVANRFDNWHK